MQSALELLLLEWRPASLRDIDDLPHDVMDLYWSMRAGQSETRETHAWYRYGDPLVAIAAHLFRVGPDGPELVARCGTERIPDVKYRRDDTEPMCRRCIAVRDGKPLASGQIGGVDLTPA